LPIFRHCEERSPAPFVKRAGRSDTAIPHINPYINSKMAVKNYNLFLKIITVLAVIFLFHQVNAQTIPSFNINIEPLPIFAGDTAVVTVVPNNFSVSSTTFQWYINDTFNKSVSGLGKDSIVIKTASDKQEIITIKVVVDPGPGFEKIQRQSLVVSIPPFRSTEQISQEVAKFKADFKILAFPPDPSPGQTIHLNIQAVGFNVDTAKIQWFLNDKSMLSGIGEKSFDLETGKLGESYRVRVNITLPEGTTNSQSLTIRVNDLSYYWWTDAITPQWYKGKALPSIHSKVTILALPEITGIPANNLIYKWLFNDGPVVNKSGFGKSTYVFSPQFQGITENITVRAENMSGAIKKEKTVSISAVTPKVQFYQIKPLEGIDFSKNIDFLEAAPASILDFIAELFFFPPTAESDLSYQWQLGSRNVPSKEPASPNILSVRSESGSVPEQFIQLNVENKKIRNGGTVSSSFRLRYR